MLEVFLLMMSAAVHSVPAVDGSSSGYAAAPPAETLAPPAEVAAAVPQPPPAPVTQPAPAPVTQPAPAPVTQPVVAAKPAALAKPVAPPEVTALVLPTFPSASAGQPPVASAPAVQPVAVPQPAPQAIAVATPQPAPQPAPQAIAVATPQPAPQPAPQPVAPATTAPVFLAPMAPAATPGLVAEPQIASGRFLTALEVKPILNATKSNWVAVREYGGQDLLYVTHLWSWRCGLLEMRVGVNGAPPEIWPLPACHTDQPAAAAILEGDGLPYRQFPQRSVQSIEVMLTYDDLTTASVRFNRSGVVIP